MSEIGILAVTACVGFTVFVLTLRFLKETFGGA